MAEPGKAYREGMTLIELMDMIPDEAAARKWFEGVVWPDGEKFCLRCGSTKVYCCKHRTMPYRCSDCRKYFSVKTGTAIESSNLPLRKWVLAIYLESTSLKGVASMKLYRDVGVTQRTAWFMLQRIREALKGELAAAFKGPVEVDEAYFGGLEKNKHAHKKANLGRGPVAKAAVVGARDRATGKIMAQVVDRTDAATLQGFVADVAAEGSMVYTDEARAYKGMAGVKHEAVKHSVSEYVNGMAHTNGIESFWAVLKRAYHGTYHQISKKHLNRYIAQFAGKHNMRPMDTEAQMQHVVAGMVGRRVLYRELVGNPQEAMAHVG